MNFPGFSSKLQSIGSTVLLASTLAGCAGIPSFSADQYVNPLEGAMVLDNKTRYTEVLECLKPYVDANPSMRKRYAVGRVNDFSGKEDLTNGKRMTQGAALMVMSALSRTGVPMVERFDTTISDMELKYSDNKLISDLNPAAAGQPGLPNSGAGTSASGASSVPNGTTAGTTAGANNGTTNGTAGNGDPYRKIFAGSLPGSDYHVVGGITEVNYNIRSGDIESSIRFVGTGARYFVMSIGVDLRLVNTKTLEVINTQSLQKQIIGTELRGGYFRIFSDGLFDVSASERTQEPIQRGVRMVIEQAIYNMITEVNQLKNLPCSDLAKLNKGVTAEGDSASTAPAQPSNNLNRSAKPVATTSKLNPPKTNGRAIASPIIDPYTGELLVGPGAGDQPMASQPQGQEVGKLRGLFGGSGASPIAPNSSSNSGMGNSANNGASSANSTAGNATAASPSNGSSEASSGQGAASESRNGMQEKLLYGNKPMLR